MNWAYWVYCQLFYCRRAVVKFCCPEAERKRKLVNPPWLWIGFYAEDGTTVSVTEFVNDKICGGCIVDKYFLEFATGFKDIQWKYIDIATLEEKDFPSEGIVIQDDSKFE